MNDEDLKRINHNLDLLTTHIVYLDAKQEVLNDTLLAFVEENLNNEKSKKVFKLFCKRLDKELYDCQQALMKMVSETKIVANFHLSNQQYLHYIKDRHSTLEEE